MGGTKFMVIKFKELVKTAIFAVLGAAIIIALIYFFIPKNNDSKGAYNPGVYTAEIILNNETVNVRTTVDANRIKAVEIININESVPVFYPLLETTAEYIGKEVVANQSVNIEIKDGSEVTSNLILNAVKSNLAQAQTKKTE